MSPVLPTLNATEIHELLERDGYLVVEDFITTAQVEHLLRVFASLDRPEHHGAWTASMFSTDLDYRAKVDRTIREVLAPRAAELLPGFRFVLCNYLVKEPQTTGGGVVQVHQDPSFVDEARFSTVGIWIPLVDTDMINGGIAVLPGSHHWNDGPRSYGGWSPYAALSAKMLEKATAVPIKAGAALVFSQKVFHGSPPNRGRATRITVTGLLASNDAPLLCYYANPSMPQQLEVFEVDDDFFLRYPYATRPEGVPRIAVVDRSYAPIRPEQIG